MHIEELNGGEGLGREEEDKLSTAAGPEVDAKRILIGAGARALFYPTLLYNVVRNKIQAEFRWWDWIDEFLLLGAVPFPADVKRLQDLGVGGVITLNEPYETLVTTSLYLDHCIDHLVLPTRDYCFAPSLDYICQAVDFINKNTLHGRTTYVHCKAGRGRSTTIVLCYLVQYKNLTPEAAYDYVKTRRPRVLLTSSQWQAVQEYYHLKAKKAGNISLMNARDSCHATIVIPRGPRLLATADLLAFDDGSVVVVTEADLEGYDLNSKSSALQSEIWANVSVVYRVCFAGQAALARFSCLWMRCQTHEKIPSKQLLRENSSVKDNQLGGLSVNIHVY